MKVELRSGSVSLIHLCWFETKGIRLHGQRNTSWFPIKYLHSRSALCRSKDDSIEHRSRQGVKRGSYSLYKRVEQVRAITNHDMRPARSKSSTHQGVEILTSVKWSRLAAPCRDSSHERGLRRVLSNVSLHVGFIFSRSSCARRVRVLDDDKAAT